MSSTDLAIGIDIVHEADLRQLAKNRVALERTFTARELAECLSRGDDAFAALARRLAAKEALVKATRHPVGHFSAIEIEHGSSGEPIASWSHLAENDLQAQLSVSSATPFAIAVAVVRSAPW